MSSPSIKRRVKLSDNSGPKKLRKTKSFGANLPSFQNRKTLADHVVDNIACAGRNSYFQRIIYVYQLKENHSIEETDFLILIEAVNKGPPKEHLTGILINYPKYAVHMIEGPEETIIQFLNNFQAIYGSHWIKNKIILIYNNVNQRFFHRAIIKYAEPMTTTERVTSFDPITIEQQINTLIRRIYDLCGKMQIDEMEENKTARSKFLTGLYIKILPETEFIDYILNVSTLYCLEDYKYAIGTIPDYKKYDDNVWPIPFDPTPNNTFDWGKYDINLTLATNKF